MNDFQVRDAPEGYILDNDDLKLLKLQLTALCASSTIWLYDRSKRPYESRSMSISLWESCSTCASVSTDQSLTWPSFFLSSPICASSGACSSSGPSVNERSSSSSRELWLLGAQIGRLLLMLERQIQCVDVPMQCPEIYILLLHLLD
jgi:hypothetical protein